jgi:Papain-like cysteine protease AvrRpt2
MPLPEILMAGAFNPLGAAEAPGDAASDGPSIDFTIQSQDADQLCWAAVAVSVALAYEPATQWQRQCLLVNDLFNLSNCCPDPKLGACNQQADLELALTRTGHLQLGPVPPLSFNQVRDEIVAKHFVCCRIETNGVGHFIVISACSDNGGVQQVRVHDPQQGSSESERDYEEVLNHYLGQGTCTHAYFTQ